MVCKMATFKSRTHKPVFLQYGFITVLQRLKMGVTNICQNYTRVPKEYCHVNVTSFRTQTTDLNVFPSVHHSCSLVETLKSIDSVMCVSQVSSSHFHGDISTHLDTQSALYMTDRREELPLGV